MTAHVIDNTGPQGPPGSSAALQWRSDDSGNSTSARFLHAWSAAASATATESQSTHLVTGPAGATYTIRNLVVTLAQVEATNNLTFTVRIEGVDTGITVTINAGALTATDTTHTATVAVGSKVSLKCVSSSASATATAPIGAIELAA